METHMIRISFNVHFPVIRITFGWKHDYCVRQAFLLILLFNLLESEDTKCWGFSEKSVSIPDKYKISATQQSDCCCLILLFNNRQIWTAVRQAQHTLCVYEATPLEVMQSEVWHCLEDPPTTHEIRHHSDGSIRLSKTQIFAFTSMVNSHICSCHGHWCITILSQMLTFAPLADNSLDGVFHFWHVKDLCRFGRSRASNSGSQPWSLCTEISSDSLNHFTVLYTVDVERSKFFSFMRWADQWFSGRILHKVVSHNPSLHGKTEPSLDAPCMPNPDTLTCHQSICWL